MSVLKFSFRLLSGVIFLFSAALMLLAGDGIYFRLLEFYGLPWSAVDIVLRIIAALFVFSGITELIGMNKYRSLTFRVIAVGLALIDVVSRLTWADEYDVFVFHGVSVGWAVVLLVLMAVGTGIAVIERQERGFKKYVFPVVLVASLGITFIRPIYIDDWKQPKLIEVEDVVQALDSLHVSHYGSDRNDEPFLTAFFTTGCPHCKTVAKKLGIAARRDELPKTVVYFKADLEKVERFMEENKATEVAFEIIEPETFMFLSQGRFPTLFYQNKTGTHYMRGALAVNAPLMRKISQDIE